MKAHSFGRSRDMILVPEFMVGHVTMTTPLSCAVPQCRRDELIVVNRWTNVLLFSLVRK